MSANVFRRPGAAFTLPGASLVLPGAALALLLAGCSASRSEPLKGQLDVSDPRVARGEVVFMSKCNKCHPGGEGGLGPALNNKPLPDFYLFYQARHGTGAMPAFDEDEVPEKELADISAYLKALRNRGSEDASGEGSRDKSAANRVTQESEEQPADVR